MSVGGIGSSIVNAAMSYRQAQTMDAVGTKVLSNALDAQEAAGAGLMKMMDASAAMMEQSVNPAVGGNFDLRV